MEVATSGVNDRSVSRLAAVPATLRASTESNSAALRIVQDIVLSGIWLPASLRHPGPPYPPLTPLRSGLPAPKTFHSAFG